MLKLNQADRLYSGFAICAKKKKLVPGNFSVIITIIALKKLKMKSFNSMTSTRLR